jgi:hypothetical protein
LELSSVCVVDGRGKIVKEAKVASEPEALVYFFNGSSRCTPNRLDRGRSERCWSRASSFSSHHQIRRWPSFSAPGPKRTPPRALQRSGRSSLRAPRGPGTVAIIVGVVCQIRPGMAIQRVQHGGRRCRKRRESYAESFPLHNRSRLDDPVEILPELLARLEEHAIGEARTAAKVAAREAVCRLLRKAIT